MLILWISRWKERIEKDWKKNLNHFLSLIEMTDELHQKVLYICMWEGKKESSKNCLNL